MDSNDDLLHYVKSQYEYLMATTIKYVDLEDDSKLNYVITETNNKRTYLRFVEDVNYPMLGHSSIRIQKEGTVYIHKACYSVKDFGIMKFGKILELERFKFEDGKQKVFRCNIYNTTFDSDFMLYFSKKVRVLAHDNFTNRTGDNLTDRFLATLNTAETFSFLAFGEMVIRSVDPERTSLIKVKSVTQTRFKHKQLKQFIDLLSKFKDFFLTVEQQTLDEEESIIYNCISAMQSITL